jgi:hypothetical protein
MKITIKNIIKEELTRMEKSELKKEIINSSDLEKLITKIVKELLKDNKDLEKNTVDITKNVLIQFHKTLWNKRNFWVDSLKNKNS